MLDDEVSEDDGEISVAVGPAPEGAYLMGDTATACTAVRDHELLVVTVLPVDAEIAEGEDAVFRIVRPVENGTQVGVPVHVSRHDKIMKVVTGAIADRPGDRGVMSLSRLSRARR